MFYIYIFFFLISDSLIPSFLVSDVSESLRLLTKNEQCEQIAQVTHQKWANERIARFFERITHSLIFSKNTNDALRKPMSEFPALEKWCMNIYGSEKYCSSCYFVQDSTYRIVLPAWLLSICFGNWYLCNCNKLHSYPPPPSTATPPPPSPFTFCVLQ